MDESKIGSIIEVLNHFYLVIFIVGTLGNLIALFVFSRKNFQNTIFSTYYRLVTIYDILTLIQIMMDLYIHFQFNINIKIVSDFFCKFIEYYNYIIPSISVWTLSIISVDRFFSIFVPFKFKFRKTKSFQSTICLIIIIYNLIYYYTLFYSSLEETPITMTMNDSNESNTSDLTLLIECKKYNPNGLIDWMDFFNSTIIPFIIMTISNGFILNKIVQRSRKRSNMMISSSSSADSKLNTRDMKYALTSIALNAIFFIFNFPITIFLVSKNYITFEEKYESMVDLIEIVVTLLFYLNFAVLFFTSVISNSLFRKEFIEILIIIKKRIHLYFRGHLVSKN